MLKIRLCKKGIKKKPSFFIVLTNSKSSRDGKFIDKLGFYDPIRKNLFINKNKYYKWTNLGAKSTLVVKKLIKFFKKKLWI